MTQVSNSRKSERSAAAPPSPRVAAGGDMLRAHAMIGADVGGESLIGLFLDMAPIRDYAYALPRVQESTLLRMPLLPARCVVEGRHMVAIYAVDAGRDNIVAWCVREPDRLYTWVQGPFILGRHMYEQFGQIGCVAPEFETPLQWLQAGMRGVVVL